MFVTYMSSILCYTVSTLSDLSAIQYDLTHRHRHLSNMFSLFRPRVEDLVPWCGLVDYPRVIPRQMLNKPLITLERYPILWWQNLDQLLAVTHLDTPSSNSRKSKFSNRITCCLFCPIQVFSMICDRFKQNQMNFLKLLFS